MKGIWQLWAFMLCIFASTYMTASVSVSFVPVLDVKASPLLTTTPYYILPASSGRGGGIDLAAIGSNKTCSSVVIQQPTKGSYGFPVFFSPVRGADAITPSTDINIVFAFAVVDVIPSNSTLCAKTPVWKVGSLNKKTKKYFIETGGKEGSSDLNTLFKIEEDKGAYIFRFCPTCPQCRVICRYLGIHNDNGVRRLVLSDVPFRIKFDSMPWNQ